MQMQTIVPAPERHTATGSDTTALVKTPHGFSGYEVRSLSVRDAVLSGGPPLVEGALVLVILQVPLYPEIRVPAKVIGSVARGGRVDVQIVFKHQSDHTEDHIQAALLSELERSQTNMRVDFTD